MESEKIPNSQRNVEKENQSWWHHNSGLQAILQSCNHQDSMVLVQKQTHRSMEQNSEPEMDPQLYGQLIFDKAGKNTQWKKDSVSDKWCWGKLDSHMQKNETGAFPYTIHKNSLKMDERPKCETGVHQNPRGEHRQQPL